MFHEGSCGFACVQARQLRGRHALHCSLPGTAASVRLALGHVTGRLDEIGLSKERCGAVELVLAEAMNNVVEHAYAEAGGDIELTIWQVNDGLLCEVVDDGRPMPGGALPAGAPIRLDCPRHDLPEGGFGWFLIREIATELCYVREGGRNRLRFFIAAETHADAVPRAS